MYLSPKISPISSTNRADLPFPFNPHSHTTTTFQPNFRKASSASRSTTCVRRILARHHSRRVWGSLKYLQPSCPCQKQPWTNTTVLYLGRTRSGVPGSDLTWRRYRNPLAHKNFRTNNSGFVSFARIRLML